MAEGTGSQLTVNRFGLKTDVVNMSDWTILNGKDSNQNGPDHQNRSDIVHAIILNQSLEHLDMILGSGWDVNEALRMPQHIHNRWPSTLTTHYEHMTALGAAVRQNWTEGVKVLLDAGAKCVTSDYLENPLTLALLNRDCPPDLIELLLQHGADPNESKYKAMPLVQAIRNCRHIQNVKTVQLLLQNGADPNIKSKVDVRPLTAAILTNASNSKECQLFTTLVRILVSFGANVNFTDPGRIPLLCTMVKSTDFMQEPLDLFFLHESNINMECGGHVYTSAGTMHKEKALEYAVRHSGHSNTIRWLIRHGADISTMKLTLLRNNLSSAGEHSTTKGTCLILLWAGMRVSQGAVAQLQSMQMAISAWLQENRTYCVDFNRGIESMWVQLDEAEERELQRAHRNVRKPTFPEYITQQMADLQEFSDESLHVYPQVMHSITRPWQQVLNNINIVLEFLTETQSLQWYCRRCVRENLVSLQPSVVKTLPIPARLKRYVLCHEI